MFDFTWGHQLKHSIFNLLFPPACANCDSPGTLFCADCRRDLVWVEEPVCPLCGHPDRESDNLCPMCQGAHRPGLPIRAACLLTGSLPRMIHRFKYENQFGLAPLLASFMAEAWPRWEMPVDLVIPVALHSERERKRGYNQATLLAQHLTQQQGWALAPAGLKRIRHTRPQVGLTAPERRENVYEAFLAERHLVAGKCVLLIDDVCTTGATLSAAAAALKDAGAQTVSGYCLARAIDMRQA